jgi:site-specific DNA-cytosine methylase
LEWPGTGQLHDLIDGKSKYREILKSTCLDANYHNRIDNKHQRTAIKQINPCKKSGGKQPLMQDRIYDANYKGVALTSLCNRYNIITHSTQPRNGKGQGGKGHLQKTDGKSYCLDTSCTTAVEYADTYRKLTPIECERLQGLPDNYTQGISTSARYHALGNGWQVDTIVEFFKNIPH